MALGGGHGLFASLSALRRVSDRLTAVVTVADDGGSSGRLRRELGVLPPGDLRMALAALCGDDDWGTTWSRVVQHRFGGRSELSGHAVGNLLIVALWELLGDTVAGLDWVGRLLGAHGRVLPMAAGAAGHRRRRWKGRTRPGPTRSARSEARSPAPRPPGQVRSIALEPPTRRPARRPSPRCARRTGWCSGPARGSPACCRTCWCPGWPTRCSPPGPAGSWSSTSRRRPGDRRASRRAPTSRCSADHAPDLAVDVVLADRQSDRRHRDGRAGEGARTCWAPGWWSRTWRCRTARHGTTRRASPRHTLTIFEGE